MDIDSIQDRVKQERYLVKTHAIQHALKEGFDREHMEKAVLGRKRKR